jgi:hypothetical protein
MWTSKCQLKNFLNNIYHTCVLDTGLCMSNLIQSVGLIQNYINTSIPYAFKVGTDYFHDSRYSDYSLFSIFKTAGENFLIIFQKLKNYQCVGIFTLFGSTYICEQTFSCMNYTKCSETSRLTLY